MTGTQASHGDGVRRLYELMRRVNSPHELSDVLHEVANGVVEGLGYGVAAISVLEGTTLVMTAVAGPDEVREAILGRRTPMAEVFDEYAHADEWGILRYVPHHRLDPETTSYAWRPDFEPSDDPEAWHPMDTLYAPLLSADGEVLGNMSVDLPPHGRIPAEPERELLEMFVVQAGLAIANAQRRALLEEQLRMGQAVQAVTALGAQVDLAQVLERSVAVLRDGVQAGQVTARCFSESGEGSELAAGHPQPATPGDEDVDLRADLVAFVSEHDHRPIRLWPDGGDWALLPTSGPVLQAVMDQRGWTRALVSPLGVGSDVLGHLTVLRREGQPRFTELEVQTVQAVGRELSRLVKDARVRQRERRLLSELQQLDRYKGELIATISHELKTPLTSIIGHVEIMQDEGIDGPSVDVIARNANRLDRLVTNLLSYSKVQDRPDISRERVDLGDIARASVDLLAVQARTGRVTVELVVDGPAVVHADPEQLPRVVDNICSNAVKYTRPGGRVTVAVRVRDGMGEVAVSDTGLGISPRDQAHVFSAFHRSTNPDALTIPGTGLGLAIAHRIAELHGGDIRVESELGRGSTFTLTVPVEAP